MKKRVHKGCGGLIKGGKCTVCGKKWNRLSRVLGMGPEEVTVFDEEGYRKSIRVGKRIFRDG